MLRFFVSHVNVHQKASTTEEVLKNQVNKMSRLVNASQPDTSHSTVSIMGT